MSKTIDRIADRIKAYWEQGLNTAEIARYMEMHESEVSRRLAKIRDQK